jgi:uncharacterized circularly permuted ATP-grasp superfamily protein
MIAGKTAAFFLVQRRALTPREKPAVFVGGLFNQKAAMDLHLYDPKKFYDELYLSKGAPRPAALSFISRVESLSQEELESRQKAAEYRLFQRGVTFSVYGSREGNEKILPFDIIPRILEAREWRSLEAGLRQRIVALNLFINDLYHGQQILKDNIVPRSLVESCPGYLKAMLGFNPPLGIWCHISGTDLVRSDDGKFYVLEDNLRCPSGVSYVLENRDLMKRSFPEFFGDQRVLPVEDYPSRLLALLQSLSPAPKPKVVVLTPGVFNSAYFEHSFLAQQMGVELVEAADLKVEGGVVKLLSTSGWVRVDVIYRRIDDLFLDPLVFNPQSVLGVPGLMAAARSGAVALVNAPGTGVADDKVIYAYVPKIIKYYLGEEPLIPNVPTYVCLEAKDRAYVLEHLDKLVVKAANESGGYGMLIGPHSTAAQRADFAGRIKKHPRNYIAQPTLSLSRVPTMTPAGLEGRHVDLRPYALFGKEVWVIPGGLTRVALKAGSLVVNSSQGGGSKDTWVLEGRPPLSVREPRRTGHKGSYGGAPV